MCSRSWHQISEFYRHDGATKRGTHTHKPFLLTVGIASTCDYTSHNPQMYNSNPSRTPVLSQSNNDTHRSICIRYISSILINLATKASRWKITLVPILMRCS